MASWLVIDWDQDHFHLLCAQSARGGVRVTQAASWPHPEPFTASTAERVGKALREFLKSAKIVTAPVIFGLGRDRVFLKELRFPAIAPHEEAGLVRFQTGKELTESVESYAVDYVHLRKDAGEREVMTVAVRRDIVTMIQTLCQTAGLRLHAITPKLFGSGRALEHAILPEESPLTPKTLNAVITVGQRWAELCFFKGRRILQAQALANGPMLVSEIKRNLAVFQAQHATNLDVSGPDCLYMFGDHSGGVQSEQNGHHLPIRMLDPLKAVPAVADEVKNPACFAGAVGLAELWSSRDEKPINLASPKRQSAPISVTRQRGMIITGAIAAMVVFAMTAMWYVLYVKRSQVAELAQERAAQEDFMVKNAQERAEVDAYKDWEQTTVLWLDEMYDLSARHPWEVGFRINQFSGTSVGTSKNSKDGIVAKINLSGFAPDGKEVFVKNLNESMSRDTHVKSRLGPLKTRDGSPIEFQIKIDVAKQDFKKFDMRLAIPVQPIGVLPPEPPPEPMPKIEAPKEGDPMEGDPKEVDPKDADPKIGGDK